MARAHSAGARLVHFPEGATCFPHKRIMSAGGRDRVGPADWSRVAWPVLARELRATAALARELRLWTVLGSVHALTPPHRPHNSLYVISDRGRVLTRYDERLLSNTKLEFMYTPGATPITFEIDGLRFGCSLGIEAHFPEIFMEYERLGVDCVLFSSTGPGQRQHAGMLATQAQAHAATNSYWVSYSVPAQDAVNAPAGVISPDGDWLARCPQEMSAAIAVTDIDNGIGNLARPWRQKVRAGIQDEHRVRSDPRSDRRNGF
jgi:predicted amidohydrolase